MTKRQRKMELKFVEITPEQAKRMTLKKPLPTKLGSKPSKQGFDFDGVDYLAHSFMWFGIGFCIAVLFAEFFVK